MAVNVDKLKRHIDLLYSSVKGLDQILSGVHDPEFDELRNHYKSFKNFIPDFWEHAGVAQSSKLIHGWHIDAIADHMQALYEGHMKFLLIAAPPRMGKSTIGSTLFYAWMWAMDPCLRFFTTSYSDDLATRDNKNMQYCIASKLYQRLWGKEYYLRIYNRSNTLNSKGGQRVVASIDGSATGSGGDIIGVDDANNIHYILSQSIRQRTNDWFSRVLISRQNNMQTGRFMLQQQRSHPEDLFGYVENLGLPGTVSLVLPLEYESSRKCSTIILPGTDKIWEDPRKEEGESLSPEQFSKETIQSFKTTAGSYIYAGQYQQRPAPEKGAVFNKEWFKLWERRELPEFNAIIQAWDTAISSDVQAAYSASSTYGLFDHPITGFPSLMLLQTWYGRLEWTELRQMMLQQTRNFMDIELGRVSPGRFSPNIILIESKANGASMINSLEKAGVLGIVPFEPKRMPRSRRKKMDLTSETGKVYRARIIAPLVENGRVWIQAKPPKFDTPYKFGEIFMEAVANFPGNVLAAKDIIDTFTMTLMYCQDKELLYLQDSIPAEPDIVAPITIKSF